MPQASRGRARLFAFSGWAAVRELSTAAVSEARGGAVKKPVKERPSTDDSPQYNQLNIIHLNSVTHLVHVSHGRIHRRHRQHRQQRAEDLVLHQRAVREPLESRGGVQCTRTFISTLSKSEPMSMTVGAMYLS